MFNGSKMDFSYAVQVCSDDWMDEWQSKIVELEMFGCVGIIL